MKKREDFIAKSIPIVQSIDDHTLKVVQAFEKIEKIYQEKFTANELELIKIACETHDLGKCNDLFQQKLKDGTKVIDGEIPHGILSALFIDIKDLERRGFSEGEIFALVTAVMYHHAKEFDFKNGDLRGYVESYMKENAKHFLKEGQKLSSLATKRRLFEYGKEGKQYVDYQNWLKYLVIKGMLNKADYNASNPHDLEVEIPHPSNEEDTLEAAILNRIPFESLYPAQRFLYEQRGKNTILIAPAGSGKTEGSLLWIGRQKGFYTLPIKVSSNAIYNRIKDKKKGYGFEPVALLHSDALSQLITDDTKGKEYEIVRRYEISKNLSYPMTVCTVDQIFKFVFKTLGTEILAATLKYSCVVIDEIQMYSPKLMAFLCYGLKVVNDLGGKFLIMTATLPPMVTHYFEEEDIPFESGEYIELKAGCRHRSILIEGDFSPSTILEQAKEKRVLVLCNTIKKAQELYEMLDSMIKSSEEEISLNILHSKFTKEHRGIIEEKILAFAPNDKERPHANGIWISTQIVEASLDIDFDVLHTEMCTIDSLFQRMGRCYRSRPYNGVEPNIYVYNTENGKGTVYDKDLYNYSVEALKEYQNELLSEEDKMKMINKTFDMERLKMSNYYQNFRNALKELEEITPGEFSKREGDYLFREINSVTILPNVLYEKYEKEIEEALAKVEDGNATFIEKHKAKECLMNKCLSISLSRKLPRGIEEEIIDNGRLQIHRSNIQYEFDEKEKRGRGLLAELEEVSQFE